MNLTFEFHEFGNSNYCMASVFLKIYNKFSDHYPEITKNWQKKQILCPNHTSEGCRCGCHSMNIVNFDNKKVVVVNFWDRALDFANENPDWEDLKVVHIIGGLGVSMSQEEISEVFNVKYTPYLYPLNDPQAYFNLEKSRKPYNYEDKIKKACFIGTMYSVRDMITQHMKGHPLIDIYNREAGYYGESYYQKMSEYAITLSLNGAGEYSVRDFESMGLGIPIVRSELLTPLMKPLIPGVHYIKGSQACEDAGFGYRQVLSNPLNYKIIADEYVDTIEKCINDQELLNSVSKNSLDYYNEYLLEDKIVDYFFNLFDLKVIE